MAVYHCEECDQWLDDDWHPMVEYKGRIMCDECEIEASADDEESEMGELEGLRRRVTDLLTQLTNAKAELQASRDAHQLSADYGATQWLRAEELQREFDILDVACDFWKQEAIDRGYEE